MPPRRESSSITFKAKEDTCGRISSSAAITPRTRLICISHIVVLDRGGPSRPGDLCPCSASGHRRRRRRRPSCGASSRGCHPLGCDFYAVPGQKWLLGPEGTGALYVSPEALEKITPTRIGWASVVHEGGGVDPEGNVVLHPDARRFETGTIHAPAFAALTESIRLLAEIGWEAIFERALSLARLARARLSEMPGVQILTPEEAASGLLTFSIAGVDPDQLVNSLWSERRIVIRSIPFPSSFARILPRVNDESDVEAFASAVSDVAKRV